ncbi:Fic family protein [Rubritalea spongiae]|uniref:Fic family protein n=1 Tax=Rubritalea spongiae TaxID=430797 RepID=A0ABW5E3X6_9BACT
MNPPFVITPKILSQVSRIERLIGRVESHDQPKPQPQLRKSNRVKTLQGSLAIEGNSLDVEQITAVLDGKRVIAPKNDILEVINANEVYEHLSSFDPYTPNHLLQAHGMMMKEILPNAGSWRTSNVGILKEGAVSHIAPQADRVEFLVNDLFDFLKSDHHALIKGCVFHYEFEFIHPFQDGNGRIGRFWHSLLLFHYHPIFEYIPVESIIKEHQQNYYDVLEVCDKAGESTAFIEFSLDMILKALEGFLDVFRPQKVTGNSRLEQAREHLQSKDFSRREYMALHKSISTATASRDLKSGIDQGLLLIQGERALSRYRFKKSLK